MFNLFELSYAVQKDMFFSGVIGTEAYSIYYNDDIASQHCNFAVFSDVVPVDAVYDDVLSHFKRLNRPMVVYVDSNTSVEMRNLLEKKFKVTYSGVWLRCDINGIEFPKQASVNVKQVQTEQELQDFLTVFKHSYAKKLSHYGISEVEAYANAVKNCCNNPKYRNFVAYEGKNPVAIATIGVENGFCMIFNQGAMDGYLETPYSDAVISACVRVYKEIGGRSLCTRIVSDQILERWYAKYGFRRVKMLCRLTHDEAYAYPNQKK